MGRLLLLALIILAIWLVWKAFGPSSWARKPRLYQRPEPPQIKGPDDDEDFLWQLEKERFKKRRAEEKARERERRRNENNGDGPSAP